MSSPFRSRAGRRTSRAACLLAALLIAVSAVMLAAAPAQATSHSVTIKQYAYGPGSLTVKQGDTVTWTNQDTAAHDVVVTGGPVSFRSPMLEKGESWSYTFATPGAYSYICSVHPDMRGSVTATAKAPAPAPASSASTHSHSQAPAPAAPQTNSGTGHVSNPSAAPKASENPAATASAAPATTAPTTAAQQPTTTLDPLLLVAGVSIAVVVFCLLLMASRPRES